MSVFININKKREDFFQRIKEVKFEAPIQVGRKGYAEKHEEQLLSNIREGCRGLLYNVVNSKIRDSNDTSKNKYLKSIKEVIVDIMSTPKISQELDESIPDKLLKLKDVCEKAGKAKFSKLTFGATLDYPKTLKEFRRLGREIEALERTARDFLIFIKQPKK